ncbi:hypothetical protein B0H67DRAFT_646501 [Lasiosphaeris hirsuta]|uniref:Uncharacterized protein n=1 Tax=Lasiosphaeris hirsuta TaxID=260670 RepID=A0AA40DPC7_9PEZI|nr:hypothetical protein B0H67DRAFT_646501 [Lasiosphaeris hirsuta]
MASFLEDLYSIFVSPFSRSPLSSLPHSPSFSVNNMSPNNQAYSALTSPSESAISDSGNSDILPGPAAVSGSHRSSISSTASDLADGCPSHVLRAATIPAPKVRLDAMSREFPKPTHEPSLEEMLARPAQKWSLSHYVKNARDRKPPVVDKEKQAQDFEKTKNSLRQAREDLLRLPERK